MGISVEKIVRRSHRDFARMGGVQPECGSCSQRLSPSPQHKYTSIAEVQAQMEEEFLRSPLSGVSWGLPQPTGSLPSSQAPSWPGPRSCRVLPGPALRAPPLLLPLQGWPLWGRVKSTGAEPVTTSESQATTPCDDFAGDCVSLCFSFLACEMAVIIIPASQSVVRVH